jgi:hypothetical protein
MTYSAKTIPSRIRHHAIRLLQLLDVPIRDMWVSGQRSLVWLDDGDVRTLVVSRFNNTTKIIRLAIDYEAVVYPGETTDPERMLATPSRHTFGAAELTVMLDEVDAILPWALSYNAGTRKSDEDVPRIPGAAADVPPERYWPGAWKSAWSQRAAAEEQRQAPELTKRREQQRILRHRREFK